jgi:hypothetical protein
MDLGLEGKAVLTAGGSKGIGVACADALAQAVAPMLAPDWQRVCCGLCQTWVPSEQRVPPRRSPHRSMP